MRMLLKIIGILLLTLVVTIAASVVIIPMVMDPNDFKDEIAAKVHQATGRDLLIEGDIKLSVFPWVGLDLGKTRLSEKPEFGEGPLASMDAVEIRAKLTPLLFQQRLEMDTLRLKGLRLNLVRTKDGKFNLDDLTATTTQGPRQDGQKDQQPPKALALTVGGVDVTDARIRYQDRQTGQTIELDKLSLLTGEILTGRPMDVALGFDVNLAEPGLAGRFTFKSQVHAQSMLDPIRLQGAELSFDGAGEGLGIRRSKIHLRSDVEFDPIKQVLRLPAMALQVDNTASDATRAGYEQLTLNLNVGVQADLADKVWKAPDLNMRLQAQTPSAPEDKLDANLNTDLTLDMKNAELGLKTFALSVLGIQINGDAWIRNLGKKDQNIAGNLDIKPFSPRQVFRQLGRTPPVTADPEVLSKVALNAGFTATSDSVGLKAIEGVLDDSRIGGDFQVKSLSGPDLRFHLKLDRLDADRYLAPKPKNADLPKAQAGDEQGQGNTPTPIGLPLDMLRALKLNGNLDVGEFKLNNIRAQNVNMVLTADGGIVRIAPFTARLYGGDVRVDKELDVREATPVIRVKSNLRGFQVGPFLTDLQQKPSKLSGKTDLTTHLTTRGLTPQDMKKALNGKAQFKLQDGAVKGFNLAHAIRQAKAASQGKSIQSAASNEKTDFTMLTGSAVIRDGVAENKDLYAKTPLLRIAGAGKADLRANTVDYALKGTVVASAQGQGGRDLQDLAGLTIPIKIRGPFEKPEIGVDMGGLLKGLVSQQAQDQVRQVQEKTQKKVEKKLQDAVGGQLKGLFGR